MGDTREYLNLKTELQLIDFPDLALDIEKARMIRAIASTHTAEIILNYAKAVYISDLLKVQGILDMKFFPYLTLIAKKFHKLLKLPGNRHTIASLVKKGEYLYRLAQSTYDINVMKTRYFDESEIDKTVVVRILISPTTCEQRVMKHTRLITPLLKCASSLGVFGMYHTALRIGSKYYEWTRRTCCLPHTRATTPASANPIFTINLGMIKLDHSTRLGLVRTIRGWNYDANIDFHANSCQSFTLSLMRSLKMNLSQSLARCGGKVITQLNHVRMGNHSMIYRPSRDTLRRFSMPKKIRFTSLQQIIQMMHKLSSASDVKDVVKDLYLLDAYRSSFTACN